MRYIRKNAFSAFLSLLTALLVAVGLHVFVYPNEFAPGGIDGVAAMLQTLTGWNAGVFTLLINLPLLSVAWFVLKKRYVIFTVLYTLALSGFLLLLEAVSFYQYAAVGEKLLPAILGGAFQGLTGVMLRIGASSGGVDVIGCLIGRKLPHKNLESIISLVSLAILAVSFIVYGNLHSVLLSAIEIFVCERVSAMILRSTRNAVRLEIVCENAAALGEELLRELQHGATLLSGKGLYAGGERDVIVCVINYRQIPDFLRIIAKYPDAFVNYQDVMGVKGNFDRGKTA